MHPLDAIKISPDVAEVPKIDLHLHAEAGPRLHRIFAERRGETSVDWGEWARDLMTAVPPGVDRLSRLSKKLITAEEDAVPANFLARVKDVLEESARSGAIYVEVRFGRETVMRPDFIMLFRKAEAEVGISYPGFMAEPLATLIPQLDSGHTERLVTGCISAAPEGLAGVDIIPEPYAAEADWTQTFNWAERLANAGLPITVHAGEFSTANVASALSIPGVRRIGHGIQIAEDRSLMEKVVDAEVALECCPTSNVILGATSAYEAHPLPDLARAGIPVTINTDNPVRFGTNIGREYELASPLGLTKSDLQQVTSNAIGFAFTSEERKQKLREQLAVDRAS